MGITGYFTGGYARMQAVFVLCAVLLGLGGAGCFQPSDKKVSSKKDDAETVAEGGGQQRRGAEIMLAQRPPAGPGGRRMSTEEEAYWRAQYKNNRTVPPQDFAVNPKKPRNNGYGEFDEGMYSNLDSQPRLPGLPGGQDIMAMMGGADSYPVAPGDYPQHRTEGGGGGFHSYPPSGSSQANRSRQATASDGFDEEWDGEVPGWRTARSERVARAGMSAAKAQTVGAAGSGLMSDSRFYPIEQLVFGGEFPDLDKPELYRLMPRDIISITVKDHPEFSSGKLEIQPDGTVRVPNLPELFRLRGMTVEEASEELRHMLQVYIKGECIVRVQANRARGGYYFVFGDVLQPGRFPMGLEPIKLSDAVLAANWEVNMNRLDADGDELGPAFPTATPRGKFIAPRTSDLANVMLVTPHRSQPVRTVHDVRQAMLGMMREDPIVKPGQIIVVPSLDPARNANLGLGMPEAGMVSFSHGTGGFSGAGSSARLPEVGAGAGGNGYGVRGGNAYGNGGVAGGNADIWSVPDPAMMDCLTPVQRNMSRAFDVQHNTSVDELCDEYSDGMYYEGGYVDESCYPSIGAATPGAASPASAAVFASGNGNANGDGRDTEYAEYRAMASPDGSRQTQSRPRAEVKGLTPDDSKVSSSETTPLRGRKLTKPKKKKTGKTPSSSPTEKGKGANDWNLGF